MAQDYGNDDEPEADRPAPGSRNSDDTIVNNGENAQEGGKEGKEGKKDDTIVVDWYGPDDPENPQNWYVLPPPFHVDFDIDVELINPGPFTRNAGLHSVSCSSPPRSTWDHPSSRPRSWSSRLSLASDQSLLLSPSRYVSR